MYSWGKASSGQLGLGSTEENAISTPHRVKLPDGSAIVSIASGDEHTALATEDGSVYTCGSADYGQTGHDTATTKFKLMVGLETMSFKSVACGSHHTVALTVNGLVYAWGDGSDGQLGRDLKDGQRHWKTPRLVKGFTGSVVLVTCGNKHNLALTSVGFVYSWGSNGYSQLGRGLGPSACEPQCISMLSGLPIAQVAAGGFHSVALTISGNVFSWGKNDFGQLGLGDTLGRCTPTWIKMMKDHDVCYVCCGGDHTALLTKNDGRLFTFGSNGNGQLGHDFGHSHVVPKQVMELMGNSVVQVACGRQHTIALIDSNCRIYAFGLGGSGQLGFGTGIKSTKVPAVVSSLDAVLTSSYPHKIFAGGDQSFALLSSNPFGGMDSLPSPVWTPDFVSQILLDSLIDDAKKTNRYDEILQRVTAAFGSWSLLNGSFLNNKISRSSDDWWMSLDMKSVRQILRRLATIQQLAFQEKFCMAVQQGITTWTTERNAVPANVPEEFFRAFIILPECHFFHNPKKHIDLIDAYIQAFLSLSSDQRKIIGQGQIQIGADFFGTVVNIFMGSISHLLAPLKGRLTHKSLSELPGRFFLWNCLQLLRCLNETNEAGGEIISYESFYLEQLNNSKEFDLTEDYVRLIRNIPALFAFPFLFDSRMKSKLLDLDARFQMQQAVSIAHQRNLSVLIHQRFANADENFMTEPYLMFRIRRDCLLRDTLDEVVKYSAQQDQSNEPVFKKPLNVQFDGEEGMDAGGVKKEFFLFLIRDLFNPDFGMFTVLPESNLTWFFEHSYEERMFEMVGIVCGLAIYNNVILNTNFPLVVYKKLLSRQLTLQDLKELQPSLAENLQALLDYDGDDFVDMFCLTFQITRSSFGELLTFDLIPDGSRKSVTKENRDEYVAYYVDFMLNKVIENQFKAFSRGFWRVCSELCRAVFHPKELMSIASGYSTFDLLEMEKVTEYKNGYHPQHRTIVWFWSTLRGLGDTLKKAFLVFLTGSDRIPITGIKSMTFYIQRTDCGPKCDRLPVAHTCFNILDLPHYGSQAVLRDKLILAITHTSGFGLV
ncbi:probable E3 ubiquitin-protein ligase HERC4 [Oscarella lobularis]|uniref:probable E3 ubiquitin-protein ligase HERC4 n=1 Tax=Oscarella lobularis TaxID=121494 RepID=UPI00331424C0